jgi:spore coat protein CotH
MAAKPKFKVKFNEFHDDQRFYGLEELSLNNSIVDCSYMKETVAWRIYAAAGVPYLRTSYARVTVNGADYGLYLLVETPNDVWLKRNYADATGNFYDGKYVWYGGYNYTLLDFGIGVDALYQLEEGTDVANADIAEVSAALLASQGTSAYNDTMGEVLDWDVFHRMTAVDQFIGHNDGYSLNTNNYRVYFDPADGKADLLPWDLDYTFLRDTDWGLSWSAPAGNITYACWQDPACAAAQREAMASMLTAYEAEDWTGLLDDIETLTYADTQNDPRRECAAADVQPTREYIRAWLGAKPAELRAWWGL